MGGGMPIGGLVGSKARLDGFTRHPDLGHITTFGGHPVTCAAALATLEVLMEGTIVEEVNKKEAFIHAKLKHPIIQEIRSSGLMMAVELTRRKYLKHVVSQAHELGVLVDFFLFDNKSFRLAPPLVYTLEQLDEALDLLLNAMDYAAERYQKTST